MKTIDEQIMPKSTQAATTVTLLRSEINDDHDGTAFLNCSKIFSATFFALISSLTFSFPKSLDVI